MRPPTILCLGLTAGALLAASLPALVLSPAATASGESWTWTAPRTLTAPGQDANSPMIALSADGSRQSMVWRDWDGSRYLARVAMSADGGQTWDDSITLSGSGQHADYLDLSMSPSGLRQAVVWQRYNGSKNIIQAVGTSNGGSDWSTPTTISNATYDSYKPQVTVAGTAPRRVAVWRQSYSPSRVSTSLSDDTSTWTVPSPITTGTGNVDDPAVAIADDGSQTVMVVPKHDGSVYAARAYISTDGGTSWNGGTTLSASGSAASKMQTAISTNGQRVTAAWLNSGVDLRVQVRTSDDSGVTWGAITNVSGAGQNPASPQLATSTDGATQVLAWANFDGTSWVAQVSVSTDFGHTWGSPVNLTASQAGRNVDWLRLAVSSDGTRQTVAWARSDGTDIRAQVSSSLDSGATWSAPTSISSPGVSVSGVSVGMSGDGNRQSVAWANSLQAYSAVAVATATVSVAPAPSPSPAPPPPAPAMTPTSQSLAGVVAKPITPTSAFTLENFTLIPRYSVYPALPAGLSIDPATGIVSGTPTATYPATRHWITASAGGSSQSAYSTLEVSVSADVPGAPTGVGATAGDVQAAVTWTAPASDAGSPVLEYAVQATPGDQTCTATASLTCTVTGLANGTAYTFTVRARNAVGWGQWSAPSNPVTPQAAAITITGSRTGRIASIAGMTSGIEPGSSLTPWLRLGPNRAFEQGKLDVMVSDGGGFTWQRRTRGTITVYFTHGATESNTVTIAR